MLNDRLLILRSTLEDIISSLKLIQQRFQNIKTADDFLKDEQGLEKLDSISMRLIAIGEGFKNVDKLTDFQLLEKYPQIPWKQVKGIRDILSHHYFDLDAETIFEICANEINRLLNVTMMILYEVE
ncbi:HepT-like ribonuclease domain-containing protein [uncultured Sulfuricurvum sp.]|uniref:HepT-like ribonuclease domain-containing protein n=1 Tax=uncultured Sulfuricurvum sp. TaxID=430693 RepID=UPI0026341472|nr:HepT-like ribonuclease domain-containing protein [uncultured Sulfuricurvum sp.]